MVQIGMITEALFKFISVKNNGKL